MKQSKYFLLILITAVFSGKSIAQQSFTLYNLRSVPQANYFDPSGMPTVKVSVGLPVISSLYLNVSNSGFKYNDLLTRGADDSLRIDPNKLLSKMAKNNYLNTAFHTDLISFGLRIEKNYFSFSASEKMSIRFKYPKDFIDFFWNGNASSLGEEKSFNFGLDFSHYREYALGYVRELDEKFTVGGKIKYLYGMENISIPKSDISITTDPGTFAIAASADILVNTSGANANSFNGFSAGDYFFKKKNGGMGLDVGTTYKMDEKFSFSASILDLGFINWKSDTKNYQSHTPGAGFTFSGLDLAGFANDSNATEKLTDSIAKSFSIDTLHQRYRTWLPSQIYIGGRYHIDPKNNIGFLLYGQIYDKTLHPGLSLSFTTQVGKWLNGSVSYSIVNRSYLNLGLGLALKPGPVQWYVVTDNILGVILPTSTKNVGVRFGLNLTFGHVEATAAAAKE